MLKRIVNQTTLTGVGSLVLSLVPYFQSGAQMNPTTWVLVAVGVGLVLWGVLKHELSFPEKQQEVMRRKEYLPALENVLSAILAKKNELAMEAGRLPLESYFNKYLRQNNVYEKQEHQLLLSHPDNDTRRKVAIIVSLCRLGFGSRNVYLMELEKLDSEGLARLLAEYNNLLSRSKDKNLASDLKLLFNTANKFFSITALQQMILSNELRMKEPKYVERIITGAKLLESWLQKSHRDVNTRIAELLRGEDL